MVEAIEENDGGNLIKQTLNLVLDTLGLPQCDNIFEARKMIHEEVKKDRTVQKHIDEIIKLSYNMIHHPEA